MKFTNIRYFLMLVCMFLAVFGYGIGDSGLLSSAIILGMIIYIVSKYYDKHNPINRGAV